VIDPGLIDDSTCWTDERSSHGHGGDDDGALLKEGIHDKMGRGIKRGACS